MNFSSVGAPPRVVQLCSWSGTMGRSATGLGATRWSIVVGENDGKDGKVKKKVHQNLARGPRGCRA